MGCDSIIHDLAAGSTLGLMTATCAAAAALGLDTSKRGVAAFLAGNGGADYRALQRLTWFYNYGDNVRLLPLVQLIELQ